MSTLDAHTKTNEGRRTERSRSVPELRFPEFDGTWEKKTLGDVGKIRMCKRIFSSQTSEEGDIPFFKIGTFGKEPDAYISQELYDEFRSKYSFPKVGDILMSASGTLGRTVIYDGMDAYYQDSNIVWIDNKEDLITNEFLYYIYQIVRYESEGGTIQRLYNSIISAAQFYRPSLPEQQKIASFLSVVDEKIQQLSRKKALLEDYKKGVMQQIFSQQIRFRDDNGNFYPDWEEKRLGDIGEIIGGGTPDTNVEEYWNGEVQWYTPTEIDRKFPLRSKRTITKLGLNKSSAKLLPKGTILFTSRATIGEVGFALEECTTNQGFQSVVVSDKNDSEFIYQWIIKNKKEFIRKSQGSTFLEISKKEIEKIKIELPTKLEQMEVGQFLSDIDSELIGIESQVRHAQEFKKGLLQKMFV